MRRFVVLTCLCVAVWGHCDSVRAQRLFVLVAGNTSDEVVRDGVRQNMDWIQTAFRFGVPKDQLVVRRLEGEKLTRETLLSSVNTCPVGENDSLVLWWLGRGKFQEDQRVLLLPDGSELESSAVRDALVSRPSRLAVMVIDAYQRTIPSAELPPKTMSMARADTLSPVYHSLFFEPRGFVEIDSAESGQRPLLLTTTGGLLTASLLLPPGVLGDVDNEAGFVTLHTPTGDRELVMERGILWRDLNESIQWDTILSQLRSVTSANYRRAMGRKHVGTGQTPRFEGTRLKYADHFVEWQP
ncbi:MAG TPA: hypothetical protein VE890_10560, partial [Thermoguttaceae bacterium]|nr:hypothetical protein [Thermoguttaceae bacterium]